MGASLFLTSALLAWYDASDVSWLNFSPANLAVCETVEVTESTRLVDVVEDLARVGGGGAAVSHCGGRGARRGCQEETYILFGSRFCGCVTTSEVGFGELLYKGRKTKRQVGAGSSLCERLSSLSETARTPNSRDPRAGR